ncbi:energy transducer TonB [Porphyrobacter sp. AAP60]|uniref:energy transducer TonB n=1 Tax=Porphyrobacter sp. AAP60 TaxID=1523423 RepID=UPI000ACA2228|nr:energy transducer TonB [Porphyrobacter sp. AAP60]
MRRTILALAALAITATPAFGAEPVVVQPSSAWNLDYADDKCMLTRLFGDGDSTHFLAFQQYWPAREAGVTVAGPSFSRFRSLARTEVRFFDGHQPFRTTPFTGSVGGFGTGVIFSNLRPGSGEPEANKLGETGQPGLPQLDVNFGQQMQFVELQQGGRTVRLQTGAMDEAFKALNQCTLDLLGEWGLDPERHLTAQSKARWLNEEALVRKILSSYPRDALAQGEQAIMRMRVIVTAEGAVESCTLIKATNTIRLESSVCDVMQRARFEPARDANGQPFRSLFATSVTYRIG